MASRAVVENDDGVFFANIKYVEYQPGTLNVILSVPHGGHLCPKAIPNRDLKTDLQRLGDLPAVINTKNDAHTFELAQSLANSLEKYTRRRPHVVINKLHRKKLDCNRDQLEATLGVHDAVVAWNAYHDFIDSAKLAIGGPGLFIDIHGHAHSDQWVELGYTIPIRDLNSKNYAAENTSIRELFRRLKAQGRVTDIQQLISGSLSLGGFIESIPGFTSLVVPSPRVPSPGKSKYFAGGYNVWRHGSRFGGVIDAIQIESPPELRLLESRAAYADILGRAIATFVENFYE